MAHKGKRPHAGRFRPVGREKVHYEAPGYDRLEKEMAGFINDSTPGRKRLVISSASYNTVCHHHPFDDAMAVSHAPWPDMIPGPVR